MRRFASGCAPVAISLLEGVQDCNQEAMSAIVPTMGTSMPAYGGIGAGVPSYGGFGAGFGGVGLS